MKINILGIVFILSHSLVHAQSIVEVYQSAKKFNPSFKQIQLELELQKEVVKGYKAAFFPKISAEGIYFYGDKTLVNQSGFNRVDNQNAINMTATLFNGGAEYTYFKYKEILPALARNQKDAQAFDFFLRLNALYFDFLGLQNQERLINKQIEILTKRVGVLKKWSAIGRTRKTDYLSTLTQLKLLESQKQEILERMISSQLNLQAISGLQVKAEKVRLPFEKFNSLPAKWNKDITLRPNYKILQNNLESQLLAITTEKSDYYPKVNLSSNYYLNRRQFGRQDDWDVAISFSWNIFDFGLRSANIQQERIKLKQLQYQLKLSEITLSNETEVVEKQFLKQLERKKILKEAYDISALNYREQNKEFNKGLIDSNDLNRALEQLIDAEIAFENIKYSIAERWYALKLICGDINL